MNFPIWGHSRPLRYLVLFLTVFCGLYPLRANDSASLNSIKVSKIPVAAIGVHRSGEWLSEGPAPNKRVTYVVGIPFQFVVPSCSPLVIQKSEWASDSEVPAEFNPDGMAVKIETTIELPEDGSQREKGSESCERPSLTTQLVKVLMTGEPGQSTFAKILHIQMSKGNEGISGAKSAKILVLFSPKKAKVSAVVLEDLEEGYLATYLRLKAIEGKL